MTRPMATLQDLIEEAKVRTLWWAICIFGIAYFLSHTSNSMWTNIPISVLILSAIRYLSYEVELLWKERPIHRQTYLSHLEKRQLSVNDSRLSTGSATLKLRRKIDSPSVEAAAGEFVEKILQDFVVDLWYSSITPDKEAPELIRTIILDVLGEISGRVRELNLVDLITRDMVDLIRDHLDLYRKNQSEIGVDVMGTLSFEERDDRLKRHLVSTNELHPALISSESEHKVLQRIVGGVLAKVLRPQEAQCPLVRCISRELLTCLVLQPVMNFASPAYINELIECIFLANNDNKTGLEGMSLPTKGSVSDQDHSVPIENSYADDPELRRAMASNQSSELTLARSDGKPGQSHPSMLEKDSVQKVQHRPAEWALGLEAATKRRSQVLAPENLENMWTKGRNYRKKSSELVKAGTSSGPARTTSATITNTVHSGNTRKELSVHLNESITGIDDNYMVRIMHGLSNSTGSVVTAKNEAPISKDLVREQSSERGDLGDGAEERGRKAPKSNINQLKRSSSTPDISATYMGRTGENTVCQGPSTVSQEPSSELILRSDRSLHVPKIRCRVVGAYFEKLGSKSFAVYSIAVTDSENKTWFVKRRYRNFERLHRHLKDIPNYSLQLPPKRFLSSSIDDYFVHQRCILLDKYLQDLLSISNVAEQHEVWDFLNVSSKNYSFGKSTSVMKTLAVNVDDAMDDIVRQVKEVSFGFQRKIVGPIPAHVTSSTVAERSLALSWNEEETNKLSPSYSNMETSRSLSDDEAHDEDHSSALIDGWHSDNELNSKGFPPRVVKRIEESRSLDSQMNQQSDQYDRSGLDKFLASKSSASDVMEDPVGMPPEWTPPNVSVPLLNLVDNIFQLNRRGWLRRQVFWISKQILQLVMEDAIDDWILRQIHWLRKGEVIAQGIRWVQNVLWPNGTFFIKLSSQERGDDIRTSSRAIHNTSSRASGIRPSSFEHQLEAARRASDVKKMILGGAPTALVSLIGHRQYRRCAKDIYYFLQSAICVKQLAYCMLELLLISVFPELRDLIKDMHDKAHIQPA